MMTQVEKNHIILQQTGGLTFQRNGYYYVQYDQSVNHVLDSE